MMQLLAQLWYIFLGVLLLGILVMVHEFGHFMMARLTGIEVMEFSVGMGPKIYSRMGKKGTKFSLRWIPFGGYCAFYGEDDVEGKSKDDPRAYNRQAAWKRMLTVLAGPVMNFVLAFVVAVGYVAVVGYGQPITTIAEVEQGKPAETAELLGSALDVADGLLPGDVIVGVFDKASQDDLTFDRTDVAGLQTALANAAGTGGNLIQLTVQRGEETLKFRVRPVKDEATGRYIIGVYFDVEEVPPIPAAWDICVSSGTAVFAAVAGLFTDPVIRESVTGPVGVISIVSQSVQANGLSAFVSLLLLISVNLGVMNLLPIPGLDGARFIFHTIEAIRRKPIKQEVEASINLAGMLLLMGLLVFMTFRDVWRLF